MKKILPLVFLVLLASQAMAQEKEKLAVATSEFAPCVYVGDDGSVSGFDVDVFNAIAQELGVSPEYRVMEFKELLRQTESGDVDAAVAGITINEKREEKMDFSHPYLDSGLRIMIRKDEGEEVSFWKGVWLSGMTLLNTLRSEQFLTLLFALGVMLIPMAHIFYLLELGKESIADKYWPGIGEAYYYCWIVCSTVGLGDIYGRRLLTRWVTFLLAIIGVAFYGNLIGQTSAEFTFDKMQYNVASASVHKGKDVGTVSGTTSEEALDRLGAFKKTFTAADDAYQALLKKKVDAVVYDEPSVKHFAKSHPAVRVVGEVFDRQAYGIAVPEGSKLREAINRALLKLRENGKYDEIHAKWFGK